MILLKDQLFHEQIVLSDYNILPLGPRYIKVTSVGHFSRICLGAINEQKDMLEDQKAPKT